MLVRQCRQSLRFGHGAVDDHQLGRSFGQQRQQSAARCTTRAQNQHPFALQRKSQVVYHVAHQADAIEVFGVNLVTLELHGVHRPCHLRAERQIGGVGKCVELERRSDVQATPPTGAKSIDHRSKTINRSQQLGVFEVLRADSSESTVNERRLALLDGVADHGVTVCHGVISNNKLSILSLKNDQL